MHRVGMILGPGSVVPNRGYNPGIKTVTVPFVIEHCRSNFIFGPMGDYEHICRTLTFRFILLVVDTETPPLCLKFLGIQQTSKGYV